MIIDAWDHRIADVAKACKMFIEESDYPIEYSNENTLSTLWGIYNDIESDILVDYNKDSITGFSIVQKTDEFHIEYFGYLSKFYILPDYRKMGNITRLVQESIDWFDNNDCVKSFATSTGGIGRDKQFARLMTLFGYTQNETGILIRNKHGKI